MRRSPAQRAGFSIRAIRTRVRPHPKNESRYTTKLNTTYLKHGFSGKATYAFDRIMGTNRDNYECLHISRLPPVALVDLFAATFPADRALMTSSGFKETYQNVSPIRSDYSLAPLSTAACDAWPSCFIPWHLGVTLCNRVKDLFLSVAGSVLTLN